MYSNSGPEPQVLDFQTQQYKLLPLVASSYAYWFGGESILNMHAAVTGEIEKGNMELLPEVSLCVLY